MFVSEINELYSTNLKSLFVYYSFSYIPLLWKSALYDVHFPIKRRTKFKNAKSHKPHLNKFPSYIIAAILANFVIDKH